MKLVRAFRNAPSGWLGVITIGALVVLAVVAPIVFDSAARTLNVLSASQNPSWAHPLGTDTLGRDILLRLLVASRLSLELALAATGLGLVIGVPFGAAISVLPRHGRGFGLRTIDTMIAFPALMVAIYVGTITGPGPLGAIVGIGIATSFGFARVVSTLAMSVGGRDYVLAARVIGVGRLGLLGRYILPNIADVLIVTTSISLGSAIVAVAGLSFLGLGIQPPAFDWGRMLTEGVNTFYETPAAALGPTFFIGVAALAFGFAGEALARAMNPVLWSSLSGRPTSSRSTLNESSSRNGEPSLEVPGLQPGGEQTLVLDVRDLRVFFPGRLHRTEIIKGISLSIRPGEVVGIVGESGSGKTLTALAIAQLVPYPGQTSGEVIFAGRDLSRMSQVERQRLLGNSMAFVFQDPMSSLNPALKIGTQLTEGAERYSRLPYQEAKARAVQRLMEVNIPAPRDQLERHPHELSGGMRQRVMIAMGLMNDIKLLIADEPTTALDVTIQAQIMDVFERVNMKHDTAILLISHNLGLVKQNCSRVIVMYAGHIVEDLPSERLRIDPLHPYTRALLAAVPDLGHSRDAPLEFIPGQLPNISDPPRGCPYHPRCPLAMPICLERMPPLVARADSRWIACWAANPDPD